MKLQSKLNHGEHRRLVLATESFQINFDKNVILSVMAISLLPCQLHRRITSLDKSE